MALEEHCFQSIYLAAHPISRRKKNVNAWFLTVGILLLNSLQIKGDLNFRSVKFCVIKNKMLPGYTYKSLIITSIFECAQLCLQDANCNTLNWQKHAKRCDLNSDSSSPLVVADGYRHYINCNENKLSPIQMDATLSTTTSSLATTLPMEELTNVNVTCAQSFEKIDILCLRTYTKPNSGQLAKWNDAADHLCRNLSDDSTLVCPSTSQKYFLLNDKLTELNVASNPWIGLKYDKATSNWIWQNNDPYIWSQWDYTNGNPEHGLCASFNISNGFHVEDCNAYKFYVCADQPTISIS